MITNKGRIEKGAMGTVSHILPKTRMPIQIQISTEMQVA